jgi:hypothetical protein
MAPPAAGLVLDHHRLAEQLAERRCDQSRVQVDRAAGRERRDDADRLRRPALRGRAERHRQQRDRGE